MTVQTLSMIFISLIAFWATWCVLSKKVRDGVFGKMIYAAIALSGYAIACRGDELYVSPTVAGVTFHGALALAAVRHWFMANHWLRVKALLCRYLHCEHCLNQDPRPIGDRVERRRTI